jgi:hypothetical protein
MSKDTATKENRENSAVSKIISLTVLIIIVTIATNFHIKDMLEKDIEKLLAENGVRGVTVETVTVPFSASFSQRFIGDVIVTRNGKPIKLEFNVSGNPYLDEYYIEIPGPEMLKLNPLFNVLDNIF